MSDLIKLEKVDGIPMATSLEVAERFGKTHHHVLRDIRNLLERIGSLGQSKVGLSSSQPLFKASTYVSTQGKPQVMYYMNRAAFSLLAMRFTTDAALEWQLKYIAAFDEMEAQLTKKKSSIDVIIESALEIKRIEEEQDRLKVRVEGIAYELVNLKKETIKVIEDNAGKTRLLLGDRFSQDKRQITSQSRGESFRQRGQVCDFIERASFTRKNQRSEMGINSSIS